MSEPVPSITPRQWQPREMLMVSEFLAEWYPRAKAATRVRLGQPTSALPAGDLTDDEKKLLQVYARWADAVIYGPNNITIIEAKIRPNLGPLEALLLYRQLFLSDPQYAEHHKKRIELMFLYAIEDPVHVSLARELGITPVQFKPSWLDQYLKVISARERRAPRLV